jgi:hypothetical protein
MNAMYAKFGLQGPSFATLPDSHEYWLFKQKGSRLVTLDIQKELAALQSATDTLHITVPTNGFTDPLLDYSPAPRFAILLSINGLIAHDKNDLRAKAQVFATDITGRRYPLLRNPNNIVDYGLIKEHTKEPHLFSTLTAITYVFYKDQLSKNFNKLANEQLTGMLECWLCHLPQAPLIFSLQVKNGQGQEKLARELCYYPSASMPKAIFSHHETIDCQVNVEDPFAYYRSRFVCDVQLKENIFRFTHHAGLSYAATRSLLMQLFPEKTFFSRFAQKNNKQVIINRYDLYPEYQNLFYDHLLSCILDQSLPLIALQDFFNEEAHNQDKLEKLSEHWDFHDKAVLRSSLRLASLEQFVDVLDDLISQKDPLLKAKLQPQFKQDAKVLNIEVNVTLEDKDGRTSDMAAKWHKEQVRQDRYAKVVNDENYRRLR